MAIRLCSASGRAEPALLIKGPSLLPQARRLERGPLRPSGRSRLNLESYTTQSRFGSFTYKRFTVPQEVHRSAKRVSLLCLSNHLKKPFSFALQRRPGRTSPPPPEAETVRPLMSCEPPQCSHALWGMDNYMLYTLVRKPRPETRPTHTAEANGRGRRTGGLLDFPSGPAIRVLPIQRKRGYHLNRR